MGQDCRCGHAAGSKDPHPCHWRDFGGRCGQPATQRFYNPTPGRVPYAQVAGVQLKLELVDTWACDAHWAVFQRMLEEAAQKSSASQG